MNEDYYYSTDTVEEMTSAELARLVPTGHIEVSAVYKDGEAESGATKPAVTKQDISKAVVSGISNKTYTGKAITQTPVVKLGSKTLKNGTDYTVAYSKNKNAGKAVITITGKGNYTGKKTVSFTIGKAKQTIRTSQVSAKKRTVKYKKVKKGKQKVKNAVKVSAQGKITWSKVSKGSDKNLTISKKGVITVKKGTSKGKHTIKVKVTAAGNGNYKKAEKTVKVTVIVK